MVIVELPVGNFMEISKENSGMRLFEAFAGYGGASFSQES